MKYELLHISSDRLKDRKGDVARRAFRETHEAIGPKDDKYEVYLEMWLSG